jgi:PKD repeat protein
MKFTIPAFFFCIAYLIATPVAAVSISEVAWMGSASSANHEWIELYNPGEAIDVDGWTLRDGMNLTITLAGTIPASQFVVLERNRSDGQSVVGVPFLNYAGALVNTGATLTLRRADGSIVDQVVGGENWQNIGGDNITKETAQYTASGWVTAPPTPGRPSVEGASSRVPSTSDTRTTTSVSRVLTAGADTGVLKTGYGHLPWELSLSIAGADVVQVNQPYRWNATASGLGPTHLNSLVYTWNMGDMRTDTTETITHTYSYPGTYVITLHATFAKREAVAVKTVTVLPVQVSIARLPNGDVQVYNDTVYDIDVSGYTISGGTKVLTFPPRSYLSARSTITLPFTKIGTFLPLTLFDATGQMLARTDTISNTTAIDTAILSGLSTPRPETVSSISTPPTTIQASSGVFRFALADDTGTNTILDTEDIMLEEEIEDEVGEVPQSNISTPSPFAASNSLPTLLFILLLVGSVVLVMVVPKKP